MALAVPAALFSIVNGSFAWIASSLFWIGIVPHALREVRTRNQPAEVVVDGDRVVIRYPALFRTPVELVADDLHSVVPLWLHPPAPREWPLWRRIDAALVPIGVRPTTRVPVIGSPARRPGPVLGLILRAERAVPQARSRWAFPIAMPQPGVPIRALLIAVDDLDAAQRAFLDWGLVGRITPEAAEWLAPKSKATSPTAS